ncbi:MAG: phosphonate ABC transporter, permease protein PhnE [Bacteroidetes bacterium]|nr:MAG: phosphonate ABC transporter, permease protein PhnE [Bacteroidota bacterium]
MKKKKLSIIKAIIFDILFWIYISRCFSFLGFKWLGIIIPQFYISFFIIIFGGFFFSIGDSVGRKIFYPSEKMKLQWNHSCWGWLAVTIFLLTLIVSWNIVEVNQVKFFANFRNAGGILSGIIDPNFVILKPMLKALAETIYLALLATLFAIPFAFILSFLAARNLMPKTLTGNTIYVIVRTIATFVRSVEAIVWAIIFCVWVGIGPFAGMLALMVHSIAALTKLYSEQIENIDTGPIEAIKATGASRLQIWIYAVIPQILSPYLAFTIYRWDINVRMATIVGFVGGGGIGLALQQNQQLLRWHNVGLIVWLIAAVVWIMDMISAKIRSKLMDM